MVMANGTGGHIFRHRGGRGLRCPGLARIVWMGSPEGMERASLPPASAPPGCASVRCAAGLLRKLLLFASGPPPALRLQRALREIRRVRPNVVLGMGHITFPAA